VHQKENIILNIYAADPNPDIKPYGIKNGCPQIKFITLSVKKYYRLILQLRTKLSSGNESFF